MFIMKACEVFKNNVRGGHLMITWTLWAHTISTQKIESLNNFLCTKVYRGEGSKIMFGFCSYRTPGNMFLWARKRNEKEDIEKNYITAFNTFNLGFICQYKKTTLKIRESQIWDWVFFLFSRPNKMLGIILRWSN